MARSRRKHGGPTRGRFKMKRLGKGYLENRRTPSCTRVVLRITETEETKAAAAKAAKSAKA